MHSFFKNFNYYGTYMLVTREIKRFFKVYHQTIIAPIVSALIFLFIFVFALGSTGKKIHNIPYIDYAGYGLIIMAIIQNSFANSSSSLIMARVLGYVNDILMTPFNGAELVFAYTIGSVVRGIIVGCLLAIALSFIIEMRLHNLPLLILYVFLASVLMSNLGTLSSLITDSFDQNSAITSYLITPLSFLSGTFYSIKDLPEYLANFNYINPFFYIIDGFRFSIIGISDGNINTGLVYLFCLNIVVTKLVIAIIDSGWKLKP